MIPIGIALWIQPYARVIEEGVNEAVVTSPNEELYRLGIGLSVEDSREFYQLSGYTGGRHCCALDILLSKRLLMKPYFTPLRMRLSYTCRRL